MSNNELVSSNNTLISSNNTLISSNNTLISRNNESDKGCSLTHPSADRAENGRCCASLELLVNSLLSRWPPPIPRAHGCDVTMPCYVTSHHDV